MTNQDFNPYKGLEAFQEADTPYFFGRRKLTKTLVNAIYDQPFLAVTGSSGSGKSSVVRAGLIPALKKGTTLSETAAWKIYEPFKPGDDPLTSLAQVFVDENDEHLSLEQVNAALAQGATGVKRLLAHIKSPTVLLIVDQFEKLFTQCQSEAKQQHFLDCLCGPIESQSPGTQGNEGDSSLRVVITIRDDFLGKCAEYPQLLQLINGKKQIVGPMNEGELRNAISQPVKKLGWEIPSNLETLMLQDVQKSSGSLPLLQYVLQQLVKRRHREGKRVSVETYQEMGGVQQALQQQADTVYYKSLSIAQQAIARSIFLELTQLPENTKPIARQVRKSQLTDLPYPPKEVETVLEKLGAARLIITSERPAPGNQAGNITVVEVAHESLIRNWEKLGQWVKENPEAKRQRDEIRDKAQEWEDKGKRREGLLRGLDLAEVELFEREHGTLSGLPQEYLRTSIRQRRNSRLLGIGAVVTVLSVVTGLWLNAQRQATIANLRANAAQAQNLLTSADPIDGLVLAIQATGESQDRLGRVMSSVQSSLLAGIQTTPEQNRLPGHQGWVNAVAISADGETIVSGSLDNSLRLWNRQGELIRVLRGHQNSVSAVAISPDGETIVSGSHDNSLRLWNRQGELIRVLRGHQNSVSAVAISPDGETIVSGSSDNSLRLWNRQGELIRVLRGHQRPVNAVAISPDGETIVSGSSDNSLRLWNRQGELIRVLRGHQNSVSAVAISPDGETIVSGSLDNSLRLWNRQGELIRVLRGHQNSVTAVAISADGETIVSGSSDNSLRLWNRQGELIRVLRGHEGWVTAVAISADGETIVSGSSDNSLRLWNRQGELIRVLRGHQDSVSAVAISADGETIVSGSSDNTLRLWNRQGELIRVLRGHQDSVYAVAISPDGEYIVSGSFDQTVRLWRLGNWQNWLQLACNQLQYHPVLVAPETDVAREAGETCHNYAWTPSESAQFLVNQGRSLARAEDIEGAVAKFKQAKRLDPTLDLDPEAEAKQIAVPVLLARGEQQVENQRYQAAVETYTAAQTIDATVDISAQTWGEICWFGSLRGEAEAVMPACEQAVTLEPEEAAYRGSQGLAKALTGDKEAAIQEFQAFIELNNNTGANRVVQGYIDTLRAGDNPFTEAEIQRLLGE